MRHSEKTVIVTALAIDFAASGAANSRCYIYRNDIDLLGEDPDLIPEGKVVTVYMEYVDLTDVTGNNEDFE